MIKMCLLGSLILGPMSYYTIKTSDNTNIIGYSGIIMCFILGALGTSRGMTASAKYVSGVCINTPRVGTNSLLGIVVCEAGLLGTILHCINMFNKMQSMISSYRNNWLMFCSGVIVGSSYLFSSTAVGIISGVISLVDAKDPNMFFKLVVFEFLPASIGIIGFVAGNILNSKITQ